MPYPYELITNFVDNINAMPRYKQARAMPPSRKKACDACSSAKVRCDHKAPVCTRCEARTIQCVYPSARREESSRSGNDVNEMISAGDAQHDDIDNLSRLAESSRTSQGHAQTEGLYLGVGDAIYTTPAASISETPPNHLQEPPSVHGQPRVQANGVIGSGDIFEYCAIDLICNIDAAGIRSRWLKPFVPDPGQQQKFIPSGIEAYMRRMLKSYACSVINSGATPPFIHQQQMHNTSSNTPLANCFSLMRVCNATETSTRVMAQELLEREMAKIHEQRSDYGFSALLAAFQAYLLYTLALFFHLDQRDSAALRQHLINLQEFASESSGQGIVASAELDHSRPRWGSWIIAEAKRRTLCTMCLFDNLLCIMDGLPNFISTEMTGLPAPSSADLWRAGTEPQWKAAYNAHLSRWESPGVRLEELWPFPLHFTHDDIIKRRERVDKWLEGVDEYGTMLYAVTLCTHGG